ncbi:MAG: hypothetical protein LC797_17900 [Chloroflexi bacterium]|nr:hypothetical protein [Chloroflexota bacterium]
MVSLFFVTLVLACGAALTRALRLPLNVAPLCGLAGIAVLTTWCVALRAPPLVSSGLVVAIAVLGLSSLFTSPRALLANARTWRVPLLILAISAVLPALVLGIAFAGVEAPVSTHDGAFHVETIARLRTGISLQTWYPIGFHASVAAVLGLMPWLDTARGTSEIGLGLAVLGPLAVFSLGLALGLDALVSAIAAAILALTFIYPYDFHLWGGWPQGMGVLLVCGLLVAALRWIQRPTLAWAVLGGLLAGAIVLSHGTEVYSSALGLTVIALARFRRIDLRQLVVHLPLALGAAVLLAAPYVPTLLGWAGGGGATSAGVAFVEAAASSETGSADWLQFALGITGAASPIDLPVRCGLIVLGVCVQPRVRLAAVLWAGFVGLLIVVQFVDLPLVRTLVAVTFPWLADYRPRQIAVVLASLLGAGGISIGLAYLGRLRPRLVGRPNTFRRLALACGLVLAFFVEGSAVSVYKRVALAVAEQNVYGADDGAAMAWLKQNARPGEMLANDYAVDAGIWAPYKADLPILLPRSSAAPNQLDREALLAHIGDLSGTPAASAAACAQHVSYLYYGAQPSADVRELPDRAALERAPGLEEVFLSGEAAVFRINVPCN